MVHTAIQLYTLRHIDEPLPTVLDAVGETDFNGVEFANRVRESDPEAIENALARTGLDAASPHVALDTLEDDPEATMALYDRLGCETLIVPYLDPERFESAASVSAVADRLQDVAKTVAERGFELQYHNHDHEFVPCGEHTAMDELLEATDERVGFELDAGWANAGGVDPAELLDRYGDRISHVHFADADASGAATELGEGDLDVERTADAARQAGVEWYVYEHDEPTDPHESLEHGAELLADLRDRSD